MKRQYNPTTILFVSILAAAVINGCGGEDATSAATWNDEADTVVVEAVRIGSGRLHGPVTAAGTVEGVNEAWIVAESQGVVESVEVSLGDEIEAGAVLARLDDGIARLSVEQARAAWENASIDLEAVTSLNQRGNASRTDLARARSAERGARAAYEQALETLENRKITTPVDGRIATLDQRISAGSYVTPGTPVARIVDYSSFRIELYIGERQIGLMAPGAEAEIRIDAVGNAPIPGRLQAVAAGSDPATASYRVIVAFDSPGDLRLKSGMAASVAIDSNLEPSVLLVPAAALLESGAENSVFVADGGEARLREVEIGRRLGGRAEVREGLSEGELVILSGTTRISDGARIEATRVGDSADRR